MSEERNQNGAIVRRYLDEAVSKGSTAAIEALADPDVVFTSPYTPEPLHGRESFKQMIGGLHVAFPDLHIDEKAVITEGDLVASRWSARGTHRGAFMGRPATGRRFEIAGMSIYRLKNGKIVEGWVNDDSLGMLQQLGPMPIPAQPGT